MEAVTTAVITMLLLFGLLLCILGLIAAWKAGISAQLRAEDDRLEHDLDCTLVGIYGPGPMARRSYAARHNHRAPSTDLAVRVPDLPPSPVGAFTPAAGTRAPVSDRRRVPAYVGRSPVPVKPELAEGRLRTANYVEHHVAATRKPKALTRTAA